MSTTPTPAPPDLRRVVEAIPLADELRRMLVRNAQEKRLVNQLLKIQEQAAKLGSRAQ